MLKRFLLPILAFGLLLLAVGCSNNPADSNDQNTNLTDSFGGYDANAESPAFGDADLMAEAAGDVEYNDPLLGTAGMDSLWNNQEAGLYHLRIVWGQLRYNPDISVSTDWSGSLTISRGAEIIRRTIHFELGQDYIPTRTDRQLIEWVSYTTVHNDGIAVDLLVPPADFQVDTTITYDTTGGDSVEVIVVDTTYPDPVEVVFETGPYSRTFTLDEIAALDTIVYLEDSNAVAFHGMKYFRNACPRGFLAGYWGIDEEGNGMFKGVWMSRHGAVTGFVNGSYGPDSTGEKMFYGKWITVNGEFEGLLRGTYQPHPSENASEVAKHRGGGSFSGFIYDAAESKIGQLRGKYKSARNSSDGFFQGRWKLDCASGTSEFGWEDDGQSEYWHGGNGAENGTGSDG